MSKDKKLVAVVENGVTVFYLTDGGVKTRITSNEIMKMKREGKKVGLSDFVNKQRTITTPIKIEEKENLPRETKPKEKTSCSTWASIPSDNVVGLRKSTPTRKSWLKKILKGGE
jgi:hypothetical protein